MEATKLPMYLQHDRNACAATITRSIVEYSEPGVELGWDELDTAFNRQTGETIRGTEHLIYLLDRGYELNSIYRSYDLSRFGSEGFSYLEEFYGINTEYPHWEPGDFYEYFAAAGSFEGFLQSSIDGLTKFASYTNFHEENRDPTTDDIIDLLSDGQLIICYGPGTTARTTHAMLAWDYRQIDSGTYVKYFEPHTEAIQDCRARLANFYFIPRVGIVGVKFLGKQAFANG